MKIKPLALLVVSFLFIANPVGAKSLLLRLKLQKGAVYEKTEIINEKIGYKKNGETIKKTKQIESTSICKVLDVVSDSIFLVEYSYKRLKINSSDLLKQIEWNADVPDKNNPLYNELKQLHPITMQLSSRGAVTMVNGMDEFLSKVDSESPGSKLIKSLFDPETLKSVDSRYFPEKEIGVGDRWETSAKLPEFADQKFVMNFVVTALNADKVTLVCVSNFDYITPKDEVSLKGVVSDTIIFDSNDCFSKTVQTIQKLESTVNGFVDKNGNEIPIQSLREGKTIVKKL